MFEKDELVWAKSAQSRQIFWPAKVIDKDSILIRRKKKPVISCVQFIGEGTCEAITDIKRLLPFHCKQKPRFLEKGQGLFDPRKRLRFNFAVKQVEEQINNSKEQSNTISSEAVQSQTTINHFEANLIDNTPAIGSPKILNVSPKKSQKLRSGKTMNGSHNSNNLNAKSPVNKRSKKPLNKRTKRTRLIDSTEEENDPNDDEGIFKQGRKNEPQDGKDSNENMSSENTSECKETDSVSSEIKIPFVGTENYTLREQKSIVHQSCCADGPDVRPLQPSTKFSDEVHKQETGHVTKAKTKRGTNCNSMYDVSASSGISTNGLNDVSRSISNGNCKTVDQDGEQGTFLCDDLEQNGVEGGDIGPDTPKSTSEDEDELPEAFSPSPECHFHFEDVVWARFRKMPHWPAQIGKSTRKLNYQYYYVNFLPKQQGRKCIKMHKKTLASFPSDSETYEYYKNQEFDDAADRREFEQALKEAEDILVRKASKKDDVFLQENEDLSNNDSSLLAEQQDNCNGMEEERSENETNASITITPERRQSDRKRRNVSKYKEIMLEFHRCKGRLVKIFREELHSDRHQKFRYGSVPEKDSLKHKSGFGPIQDEHHDKILETLAKWYEEVKKPLIQCSYIFDVWLPEAIIFCIMNNENINWNEAELIYLDHARNVSKQDADDVSQWLSNHKIDESAKQECLERAKRAFQIH